MTPWILLALAIVLAARTTLRARRRAFRARRLVRQLRDEVERLAADRDQLRLQRDDADAAFRATRAALAEARTGAPVPASEPWPDVDRVLLDAAAMIGRLRQRVAELERAERAHAARSLRRRRALVRIARHCRAQRLVGDAMVDAGMELGDQCNRRDAAIEAMTRRIAELMPCSDRPAFARGELDDERRAVFRVHLRCCASCRTSLAQALAIEARRTGPELTNAELLDIADAVQRRDVSLDTARPEEPAP